MHYKRPENLRCNGFDFFRLFGRRRCKSGQICFRELPALFPRCAFSGIGIWKRLEANKAPVLAVNSEDMRVQSLPSSVRCSWLIYGKAAQVQVDAGRTLNAMLKHLDLDRGDKWGAMIKGVRDVASLADPTGVITYATELDNLELYRVLPVQSAFYLSSLRHPQK